MIAHVVLFRPRATLTEAERTRLAEAFSTALREIPSIRRARIGERVTHGRPYEALMTTHYSHAAILEFDDVAGLRGYLEHPAHEELGRVFFEAFDEALMYDFALHDGVEAAASLADAPSP